MLVAVEKSAAEESLVPERRVKVPFPTPDSPLLDGFEVDITESTERWSEIHLGDGSILRLKPSVVSATRIEGQYDQDGNPLYMIKAAQMMSVASAPEQLRRPPKGSKVH
jgi:hypothetical protein